MLPPDTHEQGTWVWLKWLSDWGVGVVWFMLAVAIIRLGARVMGAAGHPSWPIMLLYLTALALVLRWIEATPLPEPVPGFFPPFGENPLAGDYNHRRLLYLSILYIP